MCAATALTGVASKFYRGPLHDVVVGQFEDFFGTVFLVLALRVVLTRRPFWTVGSAMVGVVVAIEISQRFHGAVLERARATWLGAHVLGSEFEWSDMLAYAMAALASWWIDRRASRDAR